MIEWLGLAYGAGKDLLEYLKWKEEDKVVDLSWLEKSGLKEIAEANNVNLAWSNSRKLESRLLDGYEIYYEIEKIKRVRRRIVIRNSKDIVELILVKTPSSS